MCQSWSTAEVNKWQKDDRRCIDLGKSIFELTHFREFRAYLSVRSSKIWATQVSITFIFNFALNPKYKWSAQWRNIQQSQIFIRRIVAMKAFPMLPFSPITIIIIILIGLGDGSVPDHDCTTHLSCSECVSPSNPCEWCLFANRCTDNATLNCRNEVLVTGIDVSSTYPNCITQSIFDFSLRWTKNSILGRTRIFQVQNFVQASEQFVTKPRLLQHREHQQKL